MLKYLIVTVLLIQGCGSSAPLILEGKPGKDSQPCSVSKTGAVSTISCPDGSVSTIQDGSNGTDGKDAAPNPTLAVQFCPGYTTTYPTTFPEFGFLISGKLYAVYWDGHNAWMAEIPPGAYMSTSTSAPCNFTVNADGTITN